MDVTDSFEAPPNALLSYENDDHVVQINDDTSPSRSSSASSSWSTSSRWPERGFRNFMSMVTGYEVTDRPVVDVPEEEVTHG